MESLFHMKVQVHKSGFSEYIMLYISVFCLIFGVSSTKLQALLSEDGLMVSTLNWTRMLVARILHRIYIINLAASF